MDVLLTAGAAWFVAQLLKLIYYRIVDGRFSFAVLVASGGMPSSHTAFVTAATVRVALVETVFSPLFGISAVLALIVHKKAGRLNIKECMPIIISGCGGALIGALLSGFIAGEWLRRVFGVFLILLAVYQLVKGERKNQN